MNLTRNERLVRSRRKRRLELCVRESLASCCCRLLRAANMGVKSGGSVGGSGTAVTTHAPPPPAVCAQATVATAGAGSGEGRPPRPPGSLLAPVALAGEGGGFGGSQLPLPAGAAHGRAGPVCGGPRKQLWRPRASCCVAGAAAPTPDAAGRADEGAGRPLLPAAGAPAPEAAGGAGQRQRVLGSPAARA